MLRLQIGPSQNISVTILYRIITEKRKRKGSDVKLKR